MKVAFLGSSEFSLIVLKSLLSSRHKVVCVVTNIDKCCGRGQKVSACPVKSFAERENLPFLQFKNISREGEVALKNFAPDALVTASFGQILKPNILSLAPHGVINVHASLLPKYRGSCPINWAIINGEKRSGVTIMKTALSVDSGDIISQAKLDILEHESVPKLTVRLAKLGGELLVKTLDDIENGTAVFMPQNDDDATYFPMLKKETSRINFGANAKEIANFVRGLTPWPVAFVQVGSDILKVHSATPAENIWGLNLDNYKNGEVVRSSGKTGLVVKCADGLILLDLIQAQNGKIMPSNCYLNGKKIAENTLL